MKLVNVHQGNDRIHALLQKDSNVQILLIQEPWFGTVATMQSDANPEGLAQWGPPANP